MNAGVLGGAPSRVEAGFAGFFFATFLFASFFFAIFFFEGFLEAVRFRANFFAGVCFLALLGLTGFFFFFLAGMGAV